MTADLLRRAADQLDTWADNATPGRWSLWDGWGPTDDGLMGFSRLGPETGERVLHHDDCRDIYATEADAAHIAGMDPTVTRALAAWLREAADEASEPSIYPNADEFVLMGSPALAVARAVLREDS